MVGRVLCSIDKLLYLAKSKCQEEGCDSFYEVSTEFQGCCLIIHRKCRLGHQFKWESSVAQINQNGSKIFTDNLDFASALVLSGNNFSKMQLFFHFYGAPIISLTTFHAYQRLFICPSIDNFYKKEQVSWLHLKGSSVKKG